MRRNKRVLSFEGMESRVVLTDSTGMIPTDVLVMPKDETLYPGADIDRTDAEKAAIEAQFSKILQDAIANEPYTGPIPEFPPPGTPGNAEPELDPSYWQQMYDIMQKMIEAIAPPDHPIMITP